MFVGLVLGCGPVSTEDGMLTTTTWRTRSDGDGFVEVPVEVGADDTSMLVAVTSRLDLPVLLSLAAPDGQLVLDASDWLDSPERLTEAFVEEKRTRALNWPVRASDEPLTPGTWTSSWSIRGREGGVSPRDPVDIVTITKADPDLSQGTLIVHLVRAEGVQGRPGRQQAVDRAVEIWQDSWAAYGLEVIVTQHLSELDPALTLTRDGSLELEQLTQEIAQPGDLVVVAGDTMEYKAPTVFGTTAGIPGSPYPGLYHFVAVALDNSLGPEGDISDEAQQTLANTMAHEAGHFMGLFHVISGYRDEWDALQDTPVCDDPFECSDVLGDNLMYPEAYCRLPCVPVLTPDQQAVLHRYVGSR